MLSFRVDGKHIREWSFRHDGSLEHETIFSSQQAPSLKKGVRTYYRTDGSVERQEEVRLHHGS